MRVLILIALFSTAVWAQEEAPAPVAEETVQPARAPAEVPPQKAGEEELRVLPQLPEAVAKKDAHSIQLEVYKSIFNKELKPDQREDVEE